MTRVSTEFNLPEGATRTVGETAAPPPPARPATGILGLREQLIANRKADAAQAYRAILRRADAGKSAPKDAGELADAMALLGLADADVTANLDAISTDRWLSGKILDEGALASAMAEQDARNDAILAEVKENAIATITAHLATLTAYGLAEVMGKLPGLSDGEARDRLAGIYNSSNLKRTNTEFLDKRRALYGKFPMVFAE